MFGDGEETDPVSFEQGFFDANIILSPRIQDFVTSSVTSAFPWSLNIDSADFATVLYSLLVVCHCILYRTTIDKLETNSDVCAETPLTADHINNNFCLSDWIFWFILFVQIFLVLEICAPVSIVYVSILYSLNYTILLYVACCAVFCPIHTVKFATVAVWSAYAFLILMFTDASILDGICLVIMNIILFVFYYLAVVEPGMTVVKFLNMRLWTVTFLNFFFIVIYINNMICMEMQE